MVNLVEWLLMYLEHCHISRSEPERRGSVVVSTSACHAACRCSITGPGALFGVNRALYILSGDYARGNKISHQSALYLDRTTGNV